ncbi:glycosyltransferase [Massilia sp. TWR1-2-2]|uniref:glycosyltransferase n=1 Tax=Massilia sp. TWR1-2-2 TaxID=2804584 RepID=UPI003CEF6304
MLSHQPTQTSLLSRRRTRAGRLCLIAALYSATAAGAPGDALHVFGGVGYGHDDNLLRVPDGAPAFGNQRGDSWYQADAGLLFDHTYSRQRLSAHAKLSKVKFQHFEQLDYDGKDLQAKWNWQVGNHWEGTLGTFCLGRIGQARQSDFLLDVVELLRAGLPDLLLVIAGDAASADEMAWMRRQVAARALGEHVLLTGWLPQHAALGYAVRAEVGLSPIPRGALFDVSSPTKLVEYLALGIACVANDIPDQQLVIEQSGAALSAPMQAAPFSAAVRALLDDPALRARLAARGPAWVAANRSYDILGRAVAATYRRVLA